MIPERDVDARIATARACCDNFCQIIDQLLKGDRQAERRAEYTARQQSERAASAAQSLSRRQGRQAQEVAHQALHQTARRAAYRGRGGAQEVTREAQARAEQGITILDDRARLAARAMAMQQAERLRQAEAEARRREREEARRAWEISTPEQRAWYENMIGALAYLNMTPEQRLALPHMERQRQGGR